MIVPHARVRNAMPATATAGVGGRSSTKRLTPDWISRCTRPDDGAQEPCPACPAGHLEQRVGEDQHEPREVPCASSQCARDGRSGARRPLLGHRAHRVTVDGTTAPTPDRTPAPRRPPRRPGPAAAPLRAASRSARRSPAQPTIVMSSRNPAAIPDASGVPGRCGRMLVNPCLPWVGTLPATHSLRAAGGWATTPQARGT